MVDVSVDDLIQLYLNTLVLYKNKPIFVDGIGKTKKVTYFDLSTQRNMVVDYKEGIFKAPTRRIGFINIGKSVVYSYRNPVRRYKIGYSHENLKFLTIEVSYPESRSITKERAMSLKSPEIRTLSLIPILLLRQLSCWLKSLMEHTLSINNLQFAVEIEYGIKQTLLELLTTALKQFTILCLIKSMPI